MKQDFQKDLAFTKENEEKPEPKSIDWSLSTHELSGRTLGTNMGNVHSKIGQYQNAIDCHRKHLKIAKELRDKNDIGIIYTNMGLAYHDIGQYQNAIDCHRKCLEIAEELGDKGGVGRAHLNMGNAYFYIDQYQMAIDCYRKCVEIAEELGDKGGVGRAHGCMGLANNNIGQYQKAIDCHRKELEIAEELGDKGGVGRAHLNMGDAYSNIDQYQKAIDCYRESLEIAQELGDKGGVATAHGNMGVAYSNIGQYQKAIDCYLRHLEIAEELEDKREIGRANTNMGLAYHSIGQYQKAIDCHRKQLEIAEELGDKGRVGVAYSNMGNAYNRIYQYQKAIDYHLKDLEIAEELDDKAAIERAHANMGNAYIRISQYQKAIACFCKGLEIAEELGDKAGIGRANSNMGCVYNSIGQYQKAIDCHRKELEIAEELGDKEGVGRAHGNMGTTYCNIGQYKKAIAFSRKLLEIAVKLGDKVGVGIAHSNMGNAYVKIGQYQKSIDCYRKDLEIAKELGDKGGVGKSYGSIGNVYHNIGQYEKAINCHRQHLEIAEELGLRGDVGSAYGNMGNVYHIIGQYQKAIDYYRKYLEVAEELDDKVTVGGAYGSMGIAYNEIGQYQKAIDCHRKDLEIAEELGDKGGVARAHGNVGNAHMNIGQYQKAIYHINQGLHMAKDIGDILVVATLQCNLGSLYIDILNDDSLAASLTAKSILNYDAIRYSLDSKDEWNTSMSNTFASIHKILFKSLLNLKQVKAALLMSDGGKAKALVDLMTRRDDVVVDYHLERNFTDHIQAISEDPCSKTTEAFLETALSKVIHQMQDGSIISYMFDHPGNLHSWIVSKKGIFHEEWHTTNGMSTKIYLTTVSNVLRESLTRNVLKNNTFYPDVPTLHGNVTEQLVQSKSTVFERKGNQKFTRDLEKRVENLTTVDNAREKQSCDPNMLKIKRLKERYNLDDQTTSQDNFNNFPGSSSKINGKEEEKVVGWYSLERPIIDRNRKGTNYQGDQLEEDSYSDSSLKKLYSVYISPIEEYLVDSKILVVPEGSLFRELFCALLNSKKEHLCEKYSLQFIPALHVLNSSLSEPLPNVGHALFVGNPIVGQVTFKERPISPSQLPYAKLEVEECSKYFSAVPLLEEKATKENVLKSMKGASLIHIAAHGHVEDADIFLTPNQGAPQPPGEEHYLLTAKDIVQCTLVARLVVLSCCYSGRGQISAEGVVGIARSFLGAGARSVLVSLWKIPDEETMEFMKQFYDKVLQGLSVCVALQKTMIELMKKYTIPVWAPFQIVGEDIALSKDEIEEIRRQSSMRKTNSVDDDQFDNKTRRNLVTINESDKEDCDDISNEEKAEKKTDD